MCLFYGITVKKDISSVSALLTALIYGSSVRSSVGMSDIRRIIGVCPQVISNSVGVAMCIPKGVMFAGLFQQHIA